MNHKSSIYKTYNSNSKVINSSDLNPHPIFKKKIISYPLANLSELKVSQNYLKKIQEIKINNEIKFEAFSTLEEISQFEEKTSGKKLPIPNVEIIEIKNKDLQLLKKFEYPDEAKIYDIPVIKTKNETNNSIFNLPPTWSLIDQPLILRKKLKKNINTERRTSKPFFNSFAPCDREGIPLIQTDLIKRSRINSATFEESLRYRYTQDNQILEENLKKNILNDRNAREGRKYKKAFLNSQLGNKISTLSFKSKI